MSYDLNLQKGEYDELVIKEILRFQIRTASKERKDRKDKIESTHSQSTSQRTSKVGASGPLKEEIARREQ